MTHRILVLGGTGPTGRLVVSQALAQGHTVTAFARRPERLALVHERLTTVAGDAAGDADSVARALRGHDVVISALGRGLRLASDHLMERCVTNIVPAMERLGPPRLIYLSAFGVGDSIRFAPWYMRLQFRVMLGSIYGDKVKGEAILRRSGLEWTLVSPVILTNRPEIQPYTAAEELPVRGMPMLSRASVAEYMLKCVDDRGTVRKRMLVGPA